jgi:hypothetical protein
MQCIMYQEVLNGPIGEYYNGSNSAMLSARLGFEGYVTVVVPA